MIAQVDHLQSAIDLLTDEKNMLKRFNAIYEQRIDNLLKIIELKDMIIEGQDRRLQILEGHSG